MPFKGFVTTLRPPRPGGDCVGHKELLINKGLRVEQGCWQVVVQSPEGWKCGSTTVIQWPTLKDDELPVYQCLIPFTSCPRPDWRVGYLGISWPPFGLRCDCGRRRVGRMEEPATRWPATKNPEEPDSWPQISDVTAGDVRSAGWRMPATRWPPTWKSRWGSSGILVAGGGE